MFGLKGKTLLFFIIATVLLSGLGVYFFISLNSLMKKVESKFEPKEQTSLLKSLTLDVNTLNNQYLNDTLQLSNEYIDSIILNVDQNIKKIQLESKKVNFDEYHNLDTIPKMLYELKRKNFELKALRNEGENDFIFSLENVIHDELKNKLLSEKDSIIVTRQITSYIRENKILDDQPVKLSNEENEEERNFFQRLFKPKEKSQEPIIQNSDSERSNEIIELDTTVQQKIDTINQLNTDETSMDLIALFDKIQSKRIRYINNVQSVEKEIYELNYDINKNIEDIINDFIIQQYSSYEEYLGELKDETNQKTTILLITIIGFSVFSIVMIFRFFKDINRNVEYQNRLKLKEIQATREAEEKQRFLNTMSHEIRTPLTSIIGYVDLLKGENKNIRAIKSSANYLYQMTNEILDIAKINMGVIEIKEEPTDLTMALKEVKDNFVPHLESKGLKYEFEIPEAPIFVFTDGQRLQQILFNLMHNAIKFTSQGHVKLKVEYTKYEHQYHLVFRIVDSGVGMSPEEQELVFEDFNQAGTHKSKIKGTGLGSGIVKKLVNLLSGNLQLNSAKGKGTSFVLSFNFTRLNKEQIHKLNTDDLKQSSFNEKFLGKSILVIDDDVLITRLYQKIINPTGAEIFVFNNPKEALNLALKRKFDLIVIDYRMPEMSGVGFLKALKNKNITVPKMIICTANAMLDDEEKMKFKAFDQLMFKPIKPIPFLKSIAEVLEVEIENEYHVESKKQCSKEDDITLSSNSQELSLDVLKDYVGSEPSELIEVLEVITLENEKSLTGLTKAINIENHKDIAFIIHQLSSRFTQIDSGLFIDTREIEHQLRTEKAALSMETVKKLLAEWTIAQDQIIVKLKELKNMI